MIVLADVAGLRDVSELFSGRVAAGRHINIQTLGSAIAELEEARVVEVVRTDSVSVWSGILCADTEIDSHVS